MPIRITISSPSPRATFERACELCAQYGLCFTSKLSVEGSSWTISIGPPTIADSLAA